ALYLCEKPPSFWPAEKLKEKFSLVDTSYAPVCPTPLPKEGYGDDACIPRLRRTLEGIFDRYSD
ncbi:Protein Y18H1A.4, partial [Aphelenchoides avenae]